jgi:hypothetical protein
LEQILLYIVTISGFSGFMLGLYSLLIPVLQRRGIHLPFAGRGSRDAGDYEVDEIEDPDTLEFAAASFSARRSSLLERLPRRAASPGATHEPDEEDDTDGDELLGDIDLTSERAEVEAEDDNEYADEDLAELTYEAEVDPPLDELAADEDVEYEDDDDEDGEDEEDEEGDDDAVDGEEEEEERAPEQPVVHVVSAGGSNDMLALFDEGTNVVKEVETWRADLPNPTISELLTEAEAVRALFRGGRPRA